MVCEDMYDDNPKPRVTVISVHARRHEAIDAARILADGSMYYVDDAPAPEFSAADREEFWGQS